MNTKLPLITTAIGTGAMPAFDSDIISKAQLLQQAILTLQLSIQQIFLISPSISLNRAVLIAVSYCMVYLR